MPAITQKLSGHAVIGTDQDPMSAFCSKAHLLAQENKTLRSENMKLEVEIHHVRQDYFKVLQLLQQHNATTGHGSESKHYASGSNATDTHRVEIVAPVMNLYDDTYFEALAAYIYDKSEPKRLLSERSLKNLRQSWRIGKQLVCSKK